MQLLKFTCVVIPLVLLLVANASTLVYDEVYDDEGKVITEYEIKAEIAKMPSIRPGQCFALSSACVGLGIGYWGFMSYALSGLGNTGDDPKYIIPVTIVIGVVVIAIGYIARKNIDREKAIERIKEIRRTQKQNEDKESLIPESKITLTLLSGSF